MTIPESSDSWTLPRWNGPVELREGVSRLGVRLRHDGMHIQFSAQTSGLANLLCQLAQTGFRVSVHRCRDSHASP